VLKENWKEAKKVELLDESNDGEKKRRERGLNIVAQ